MKFKLMLIDDVVTPVMYNEVTNRLKIPGEVGEWEWNPKKEVLTQCFIEKEWSIPCIFIKDISESSDRVTYEPFKIGTHGEVALLSFMGSDRDIADAAWVSTGKTDRRSDEEVSKVIRYMMANRHTSPFEMCETKWYVKLPIFVARQWVRHRTASINEESGRHKLLKEEFFIPDWRSQHPTRKQGSSDEPLGEQTLHTLNSHYTRLMGEDGNLYREMAANGVANELARCHLPLSTYTSWYWKIDLHNLMHFLQLRDDLHAQPEIRDYAKQMRAIVEKIWPITMANFDIKVMVDNLAAKLWNDDARKVYLKSLSEPR